MNTKIRTLLQYGAILVMFLLSPVLATQAAPALPRVVPCFVDVDAVGGGTGTSWEDAYTDLQYALNDPACTEVWVAAGTYYPGMSRESTFQLKNGVVIYGGFAGGETSLDERQWQVNLTILSGDIGPENLDAFHVVKGSDITQTAILDGFAIMGGHADGTGTPTESGRGGGVYLYHSNVTVRNAIFLDNFAMAGGGLFSEGGQLLLENVAFSQNTASENGGGLHTFLGTIATLVDVIFTSNETTMRGGGMVNWRSDATLTNVTFYDNTASIGGGMMNVDVSVAMLTNVIFDENNATNNGGGFYNRDVGSNATLINVIFRANTANNHGGGLLNDAGANAALTNVTFADNGANNFEGGGIYNFDGSTTVTNAILWGNTAPISPITAQIYHLGSGALTISYGLVENGCIEGVTCSNLVPGNPDPLFVNAAIGNFHLQHVSPAINVGDNAAPDLAGITSDFDGNPRISASIVDLGALEVQFIFLPMVKR